jgi:hypothetical protein
MLRGTASTAVRRLRFPRRAASGLVAIVVGLAAGGVVGLGVVTAESSSRPVTRAVLGDSRASLVSPDATVGATSGVEQPTTPSAASVVALTGSGRLARAALTAGDIPPAAWAAYVRAAAVMAQAAPRCELDWTVLAAIGLAESDHGRDLPSSGAAAAAPSGDAGGSAPDSDAGQLDGDPHRDVPVGPMRLLPSTWQVIGVDGDGDGVRSPADIDDAALAVGVALCAGDARLGTEDGLRAALLRFAPSPAYVDLILRLARAYAQSTFGAPTSIDVTAVAHPVLTGARTTLARKSLARRVEAAQSVAAESVGVGTSATAVLLTTATTTPGRPGAGGASLSLTDPDAPGAVAVAGPVVSTAPDPAPTSPSGDPSGETATGSPTAGPTSGSPATDPPASDPPASDPPASDPPASDPPASDPPASDPPASEPPDPGTGDGTGSGSGGDPAGTPQECPAPGTDPSADPTADPSAGPTADPTPTGSATPCPDPSGASAASDPPAESPAAEGTAP